MVGPSSSHTAGALRLGLLARALLGRTPERAKIGLHGSFSTTYRGHGTDRAVVAGLLGMAPDDARIPRSLEVAREDAWVVELWGDVRRAGFTRELGFEPDVLEIFERAVGAVFDEERKLLVGRLLGRVTAEEAAQLVERALPLVHRFFARAHEIRVREFFATV